MTVRNVPAVSRTTPPAITRAFSDKAVAVMRQWSSVYINPREFPQMINFLENELAALAGHDDDVLDHVLGGIFALWPYRGSQAERERALEEWWEELEDLPPESVLFAFKRLKRTHSGAWSPTIHEFRKLARDCPFGQQMQAMRQFVEEIRGRIERQGLPSLIAEYDRRQREEEEIARRQQAERAYWDKRNEEDRQRQERREARDREREEEHLA